MRSGLRHCWPVAAPSSKKRGESELPPQTPLHASPVLGMGWVPMPCEVICVPLIDLSLHSSPEAGYSKTISTLRES